MANCVLRVVGYSMNWKGFGRSRSSCNLGIDWRLRGESTKNLPDV